MQTQYTDVSAKPAAGGIDSYSSRAKIGEDYVEDAVNMDVDASGRWSKRPGYETNYGWLPLRARRFVQNGSAISIHFDSSTVINLSTVNFGPVVVYGKLPQLDSYGTSSFSDVENVVYFDSFSLTNRDSLTAGTHTLSKAADDTGLMSKYAYVGILESLSAGDTSNAAITPGLVQIDTTTYDVDVEYTVAAGTAAYFLFLDKAAEAGVTYVAPFSATDTTVEITSATHGLTYQTFSVKVFDVSGTTASEVIPELVYIKDNGTVGVSITGTVSGYIIISTVDPANTYSAPALAGTNTISLTPPSPFSFYYIYAYNSAESRLEQIMPGSIEYDAVSNTTSISYELATGSETVQIYYEAATTIANIITLTDPAGSATIDTTEGSIVVWGMGHDRIYTEESVRGGHVHHLDTYKSALEEQLVAGVNGSLYQRADFAQDYFLMDTRFVGLNARVSGAQTLGPLFVTADEGRTRGNVIDASIFENKAWCTDVAFVSEGVARITLSFTAKTGNIADCIGTLDYIDVSGMSDDRNNGRFLIRSVVSEDTTSAVLELSNANAFDDTIEESFSSGLAGVFTDVLEFTAYHRFLPDDVLSSTGVDSLSVQSIASTTAVVLGGVTGANTYSANLLIVGSREGRVMPLRTSDNVADVENFVRGDSLEIDGITQKPVVLNVQTGADVDVTAVTSSGVTTLALGSARVLNVGGRLTLFGDTANVYNGEYVILSVDTDTSITLATPDIADGSGSCKMLGKCVELDQSLSFGDAIATTYVRHAGRWAPIEAPSRGASTVVSDTSPILFSANEYSNQPNVSSTIVADSMYFGTGDDPVMKYDGVSVTQAGLTRTIPSVFMTLDTSVPSILKGYDVAYTAVSAAGKSFTIGVDAFRVGDRVYDSTTETIFTITNKHQDIANSTWKLVVAGDTSGLTGTGTLTAVKRLRYYIRFNLIDRNNNILSSNAANSSDMYFDLVESGRVKIKCSYYYPQGFQDYTRLEVELYRALSNTPAPFYLTKRLAVDMSYSGLTSLEFVDDNDDEFLTQLDSVSSALLQTEIGKGWQPPYRARAVTTLDNRLILANLKGWPRWDLTLKPTGIAATQYDLDGFSLLFKKDNTDTETTPDFQNRVKFQFENAGSSGLGKATSFTFTSTEVDTAADTIVVTGLTADDGIAEGSAMRFTTTGTLPAPLVAGTTYYGDGAYFAGTVTVRLFPTLNDAKANTNQINLTDGGTGTHTLTCAGEIWDGVIGRGEGFTTGDWIYLFYRTAPPAGASLSLCGWYQVEANANGTASILGWGRGEQEFGAPIPDTFSHVGTAIPVWIGTDYNYGQVNGNSTGSIELIAARRLADAINFVMSYNQYLDKAAYPGFQPWLTAYAGSDYAIGQTVVEVQLPLSTTPELVVGTLPGSMSLFANNLKRDSGEEISASTVLFPSRVAISYRNYAELFDNLDGDRTTSDSVIDINPADGQEIKAIIPFFGESTFNASQLDQALIVFKERSIYALDTTTREYKRVDSRGVGCSAPFSVTSTAGGVMFAYLGGIYRIDTNYKVTYVGKMMGGKWKSLVNRDALACACASHWGSERKYKLSLPAVGDAVNSHVFVMKYDREEEGLPPAWSRYDNTPATLYANFGAGNFFGSTGGIVFSVRQYGLPVDYRDNTEAIASSLTFRAEDFGIPGVRKTVPSVSVQYDTDETDATNIAAKSATNLSSTFETMSTISVDETSAPVIKYSVNAKKGTHVQIKIEHSEIDEGLSIAGLNYKVGRLATEGVPQAADYE